jgi:hypothetical protein
MTVPAVRLRRYLPPFQAIDQRVEQIGDGGREQERRQDRRQHIDQIGAGAADGEIEQRASAERGSLCMWARIAPFFFVQMAFP